jgi:hypothetical protein
MTNISPESASRAVRMRREQHEQRAGDHSQGARNPHPRQRRE